MEAHAFSEAVQKGDPDRYLAILYAPADRREALWALYAFDLEIAEIRHRVREPLPGEIRIQWWRDVIAAGGEAGGHPLADALLDTIRNHSLPVQAFENYLDARIFDLYADPMPSRNDLEGYCGETSGAMMQLAALILEPEAASDAGALSGHGGCALEITRILHRLPADRARGQCFVPVDLLAAAGITPEAFVVGNSRPAEQRVIEAMQALAREHLEEFRSRAAALPASLRPAFLPLAPVPAMLARMAAADQLSGGRLSGLPAWRRHWLIFRRAARGW